MRSNNGMEKSIFTTDKEFIDNWQEIRKKDLTCYLQGNRCKVHPNGGSP